MSHMLRKPDLRKKITCASFPCAFLVLSPSRRPPILSGDDDTVERSEMKYDYRDTTVEQDRQAAQRVWERVEGTRRQQRAPGGDEREGSANQGEDRGQEDQAVRLMQKNYR